MLVPCDFAVFHYGLKKGDICPELVRDSSMKYTCRLIERDRAVRKSLVTGECELDGILQELK